MDRQYIAIDLKSYYASVECRDRGLDPLTTNLVVADASRTEKTICLAVSPSLKAFGLSGRPRLFEVIQKVKEINEERQRHAPGQRLIGESYAYPELMDHPELALSYIVATPRMAHYIECSTLIYQVYLRYIAPEDIHVYSIDEVFLDATDYLHTYHMTAHELAMTIIRDVLRTTGITATAGIGTNLYLCKVAMDIVAKKMPADENGVRIATLDERSYRELLWEHQPLTAFWRVGRGIADRLAPYGVQTMGDIAKLSLTEAGEDLLYRIFGVNAELLIDHAWGWESCTMADIKAYKPQSSSLGSGQVLSEPYSHEKARLIVREMIDQLVLDLVEKRLCTSQLVLNVGYDIENLKDPTRARSYQGSISTDAYGRRVPKSAHGSQNLSYPTSSTVRLEEAALALFDRITDPALLVRRLNITATHLQSEDALPAESPYEQLDFFTDYEARDQQKAEDEAARERERRRQEAVLQIHRRYGKNAILRGMNLEEGATGAERNQQIGGHKA